MLTSVYVETNNIVDVSDSFQGLNNFWTANVFNNLIIISSDALRLIQRTFSIIRLRVASGPNNRPHHLGSIIHHATHDRISFMVDTS